MIKVLNHACQFSGFLYQLGVGLGLGLGRMPTTQFPEIEDGKIDLGGGWRVPRVNWARVG